MSALITSRLETPPGYRSREVARFVWQLDEQRRSLLGDIHDLAPEELGWQPAPGMNTIGMLLAHIAFAETHIVQVGVLGEAAGHVHDVIGITEAEEGMPLADDAAPPAALDGRPIGFFHDLLARAREHTRTGCRSLEDADLERVITRPPRPDGTVRVLNPGWALYHLLEHEAGHRGQILLLRHLKRASAAAR